MPISASSATPGSTPSRGLRKPASTTFLHSPSSPSASLATPGSAGGGWKSIFRIPSSKKLNIVPVKEQQNQDDLGSSVEHGGSYHSSRSSGSDGRSPHVSTPQTYSPSSYKQAPPSPLTSTPKRQKSGFLARKLSSARQLAPHTAQASQTTFRSQSGGYGNGVPGGSPSIPPSPKSSLGNNNGSSPAARLLRRVASAPNAKGLLNSLTPATTKNGLLAPSLEVPPLPDGKNGSLETTSSQSSVRGSGARPNRALTASSVQRVGEPPVKAPFRRTYSSNSMKHRAVEVRPSSFQKIKMLGRGDVGKVYLVREKKTDKLFAMKGLSE